MNKDLFAKVFNNILLSKEIFNNVRLIHRNKIVFKYNDILNNTKLLASHKYLNLLMKYYERNPIVEEYSIRPTLISAIRSGALDILKYYFDTLKINMKQFTQKFRNSDRDLMYYATDYNQMEIIRYLYSFEVNHNYRYYQNDYQLYYESLQWNYLESLKAAATINNLEILKFMSDHVKQEIDWSSIKSRWPPCPFEEAATQGCLPTLKWLVENRPNEVKYTHMYEGAVYNGNLDVIQYLFENGIEYQPSPNLRPLLDIAILCDQFSALKYLYEHGITNISNKAMNKACDLEMFEWLNVNISHFECTRKLMNNAVKSNNFEMVKWLHFNRTEGCDGNMIELAAWNGNLEMVEFLHNNQINIACSHRAIDNAAEKGHLEVIQWLHHNRTEGCSTNAMDNAARYGHLHVVKWLHNNRTEGCTINAIDETPSLEITKWLFEHRTEGCSSRALNYSRYKEKNQWLIDNNKLPQQIKFISLKFFSQFLTYIRLIKK